MISIMTSNTKQTLLHQLNDHSATVAVIGLGYVGLPLAVALRSGGERLSPSSTSMWIITKALTMKSTETVCRFFGTI